MISPRFIEVVKANNGGLYLEVWRLDLCCYTAHFESLLDLLNDLLCEAPDYELAQIIAPEWRDLAIDALDSIIPNISKESRSLSEKFILYQQIHGKRELFEYNIHVCKDFILDEIWPHSHAVGDQFDTYANVTAAFDRYGMSVPVKDYYGFDLNRDFCNWVLQQVIDLNLKILKCAYCKRYFIPRCPTTQKCCCDACKQAYWFRTNYCGEKQLVNLFNAIKLIFDRKNGSDKAYTYRFPAFDPNCNPTFLFDQAKVSNKEPLTRKEFNKLRQAFYAENRKRREVFCGVYTLWQEGELSEQTYVCKRDEYLAWLKSTHLMLKSFSRYKNVLEEIEDDLIDEVDKTIEAFCSTPRTITEISTYLGYKTPGYVKSKVLAPLLQSGRIKIINPVRPRSKPALYQTNSES